MSYKIRRLIALFIVFVCIVSGLSAVITENPKTSFTIRAYKNVPDPILMTIYDALTGTLNEINAKNNDLDIYPYMGSFLSEFTATGGKINNPKTQVLFSYQITGSSLGDFSMGITMSPFVGPTEGKDMDVYIELVDTSFRFQKTGNNQNSDGNFHIAETGTHASSSISDFAAKKDAAFDLAWNTRADVPGFPMNDYWITEGVILLSIPVRNVYKDKENTTLIYNGYEDVPPGRYVSTVTVTLTYDR